MDAPPITHIEIMNGKALIAGRNLKAKLVAAMVVKAGATVEEAMEIYELTRSEVHAALAYYYDHQEAIEQSFDAAEEYVKRVGIASDQKLEHLRKRLNDK